jgi:hypothetical protein
MLINMQNMLLACKDHKTMCKPFNSHAKKQHTKHAKIVKQHPKMHANVFINTTEML